MDEDIVGEKSFEENAFLTEFPTNSLPNVEQWIESYNKN